MAQSISEQSSPMLKVDHCLNLSQLFDQLTHSRPDTENRVKGEQITDGESSET